MEIVKNVMIIVGHVTQSKKYAPVAILVFT
jgi:hypothetical protein